MPIPTSEAILTALGSETLPAVLVAITRSNGCCPIPKLTRQDSSCTADSRRTPPQRRELSEILQRLDGDDAVAPNDLRKMTATRVARRRMTGTDSADCGRHEMKLHAIPYRATGCRLLIALHEAL